MYYFNYTTLVLTSAFFFFFFWEGGISSFSVILFGSIRSLGGRGWIAIIVLDSQYTGNWIGREGRGEGKQLILVISKLLYIYLLKNNCSLDFYLAFLELLFGYFLL